MIVNQHTFDAAYSNGPVRFAEDCTRICAIAAGQGIRLTPFQAQEIWECYSGQQCAQWLALRPGEVDGQVAEALVQFIERRLNS